MMKAIAIAVCFALAGCVTPGGGATPVLGVLEHTTVDEKALLIGWQAYDGALYAVEAGIKIGVVHAGNAAQVKQALTVAWTALNAASAARKAGSTQNFEQALAAAGESLAQVHKLVGVKSNG